MATADAMSASGPVAEVPSPRWVAQVSEPSTQERDWRLEMRGYAWPLSPLFSAKTRTDQGELQNQSDRSEPVLECAHRFRRRAVGTLFRSTESDAVEREAEQTIDPQKPAANGGRTHRGLSPNTATRTPSAEPAKRVKHLSARRR